jgi:hypothetical protein
MKDWVRPFLLEQFDNPIDGKTSDELKIDKETKEFSLESFKEEIESDEVVYYDLVGELNTHFGLGSIGGPKEWITYVFGSVLADLPREVFMKIRSMDNLCFIYTPNPCAEVKHIWFEVQDLSNWEGKIIVVNLPYNTQFMPVEAARGEIAHEIAHVDKHPAGISNDEKEKEADETAKSWGFENEIEAHKKYNKEYVDI